MNKTIYFLFLLLTAFCKTYSQSAFNDAILLKSFIKDSKFQSDPASLQTISAVLRSYTVEPVHSNPTATISTVINEYDDNQFIKPYLPKNLNAGGAANFLTNLGNLDVTAFADGLAKFLVKRTKEELYVSFFSKLQDSTKYPEFKILFPHTKLLVDNFNNWEYANITNTLREAFDKDFKVLLTNIPKLNSIDTTDTASCKCDVQALNRIKKVKKFYGSDNGLLFLASSAIANGFITEQKIPDIFHNVSGSYLEKISIINNDLNKKNAIKLFDIISYSLKSSVAGESYIRFETFNTLDDTTRRIYFGLLYQQLKNENIIINNVKAIDVFTPENVQNAVNIKLFFRRMLEDGNEIAVAFAKLKDAKKKGEEDISTYWAGLFESGQIFLDKTTSNLTLINPVFQIPPQVTNVLALSSKTLEVAHDIAVRNYSAVVVGTLSIISEQLSNSDDISEFKSFFVKYASFAANVAQAKNSNDVEKAIEAVVLPVGSARIKRETVANISLNAFVGLHASHEFIKDVPDNLILNAYGITAPVGVSFAWGSRGKANIIKKRSSNKTIGGKSNGFLISLVDLGAITTLRFGDDKTEQLPTVQLKDIISPGVFYSHGFGKCPISLNVGGQYGPLLRKITSGETTIGKAYWRVGISLVVDIPLLNLYTKN